MQVKKKASFSQISSKVKIMKIAPKTNVLMIVVDQMRADCIGASGNKFIRTPTMDSLIRTGHYFTHARTELPSCIGARRSIESGQSPEKHKMIGYLDNVFWDEKNTFDHILKNNGYYTMNVGKRHNFPRVYEEGFSGYLYNRQYEEWRDFNDGFFDHYHDFLKKNDRWYYGPYATHSSNNGFLGSIFPLEERFHPSSWTAAEGIRAIEHWSQEKSSQPFFLHLSFTAPHPPFTPPVNYFNDYIHKELPKPVFGDPEKYAQSPLYRSRLFAEADQLKLAPEEMHRTTAAYYGLISHVDACIHSMLFYIQRELKSKSVLENTIVILTGDHGEMLGDHGRFNKAIGYEGALRIPMVFNFPPQIYPQIKEGIRHDELSCNQDLLPTLLGALQIDAPPSVTGLNWMPLIEGQKNYSSRDILHGEHFNSVQFLVSKEFKYIWNLHPNRQELYHLKEDPLECKNIAEDPKFQNKTREFEKILIEKLSTRGDLFVKSRKLCKPSTTLKEYLQKT